MLGAVAPCGASGTVTLIVPDLAALSRLPSITLPPSPVYARDRAGGVWSVDEIAAEFGRITDRPPAINFNRPAFVRPDHRWLVAFNDWFMRLQKALKLAYRDEVWDCDDFARCFVAFANMVALGGGETRGSICVGWATVANLRAFGGQAASSGGGHAIVIVGSADGLFVIEPQSGKMAALPDYPNRDSFVEVNL
ncbi:MAG: hypothetical protein HZA93_10660 [Verrucomicrobia bacterium]|nr:hypothetical protein [Verrucomicrobiota bacterium]